MSAVDKFPKIIAISMVKNEQDIIEPFVRHNLQFVDYLIVADNMSADGTRDIIRKLACETGKVGLLDRREFAHNQSDFMTGALKSLQQQFRADYVFFLDADEFIGASNREDLEKALAKIPVEAFGKMPWRTYVLPDGLDTTSASFDPPKSMTLLRKVEREQFYKAVLRLDGKKQTDFIVSEGNHVVFEVADKPLNNILLDIPLLHFPVRSVNQLKTKSINGWMAILEKKRQNRLKEKTEAFHWRQNFERTLSGEIEKDLVETSFFYAQKRGVIDWEKDSEYRPHGISYERKYSDGAFGDPLNLVSKAWEASMQQQEGWMPQRFHGALNGVAKTEESNQLPYLDVPFLKWLLDISGANSALDVACHHGERIRALAILGVEMILGVGNLPHDAVYLHKHQYARRNFAEINGVESKFDLILCLGALKGMDSENTQAKIRMMAQTARKAILFTYDDPVQMSGRTLPDEQNLSAMLEIWAACGWSVNVSATLFARALAANKTLKSQFILLESEGVMPSETDLKTLLSGCDTLMDGPDLRVGINERPFMKHN